MFYYRIKKPYRTLYFNRRKPMFKSENSHAADAQFLLLFFTSGSVTKLTFISSNAHRSKHNLVTPR